MIDDEIDFVFIMVVLVDIFIDCSVIILVVVILMVMDNCIIFSVVFIEISI